jgi:hypothetical protein
MSQNKQSGTVNKISRIILVVLFLAILSYSLFTDTFAVVPNVVINESGNLTNISANISTTLSLQTGLEYLALRLVVYDSEFYDARIYANENFSINYTIPHTHKGLRETLLINRILQNVTKMYNITNLFNTTANVSAILPLPNETDCDYDSHSLGFTPIDFIRDNQTIYLNTSLAAYETQSFNVTCITPYLFGYLYFPPNEYELRTADDLFTNQSIKILPQIQFSTTKEMYPNPNINYANETTFRNWTIHFDLVNDGNISINMTKIHLWATSIDNTTNDPSQNKIHDANFTSCLSGDNLIDQNEVCQQRTTFNSYSVPVVWSEAFFDNVFNFFKSGLYYLQGLALNLSLTDFAVTLEYPPNMSIWDINTTINFTYYITNQSDCTLYTNISGTGLQPTSAVSYNSSAYDTINYTSPSQETLFIWNVFCRYTDGSRQGFANDSWYVYTNALPRIHNDTIPDYNWSEDTNLTLNLGNMYYDLENEDFNFTLLPSTILNISYVMNNVTKMLTFVPDPDWYGSRLVQIRTTDIYGRNTTSNTILLNVTNVYDPPRIVWWNVSNATWQTQNETNLTFTENETIRFETEAIDADIFSVAPSEWFYWFLDGILQYIGKIWEWGVGWFDSGMHNITLKVNDTEGLYDIQTWLINITNQNRPPLFNNIPILAWRQNTSLVINLSEYFFDQDFEELNYSIASALPENITINMSNSTKLVNLTPLLNWYGNDSIIFRATDIWGATNDSNNITLVVYPYIVKAIPNITFEEDSYNDTLNLSNYYNTYYERADITWTINGSSNVNVNLNVVTWQVNFTSLVNFYGNESIMFIAKHTNGYVDNYTINVEVYPKNDPPIINDSQYQFDENTIPPTNMIDLWNISYDPDNTYDELNYTIESNSNSSLLTCGILSDRYINCTPPPYNWWGTVTLNVSVFDGQYYDYSEINITVFHYDLPPIVPRWFVTNGTISYNQNNGIYNLGFYENTWINWSLDVYDIENDDLNYYWFLNGTLVDSGSLTQTKYSNQTLNYSKFFDYFSAGDYNLVFKVNQTNGDIPGQYKRIQWNIIILNKNRAPTKPNLTLPLNDSFITTWPQLFSWTPSFDPDSTNYTKYDYWNVSYILQIDEDYRFYSPDYQIYLNTTSHTVSEMLVDDFYYWRVIATDGDDSSISDLYTFLLDINPPVLDLSISPNPAEFLYREIDVTWSAQDIFLEEAYVNVSYPNGSWLAQYFVSPFTLTPLVLTTEGNYPITVYAKDRSGNYNILTENLQIVNDTTAPNVLLASPEDKSLSSSGTTIFSYTYQDYARLKNCTLYYQIIKQYKDVLGNVLYEDEMSPWVEKESDLTIDWGYNYFVVPSMVDSVYRWNVLCYDVAGNSAFAERNWSFEIDTTPVTQKPTEQLATYESAERIIQSKPGYDLEITIPAVYTSPGKELELEFIVENTGDTIVQDISFRSTLDWIEIDTELSSIDPGEKISIPYVMRVPYDLGEKIYHIIALSENVNAMSSGYVNIGEGEGEPPVYVIKQLEQMDEYYNITINIINSLSRPVRMYVEDYITGMQQISYEDDMFEVSSVYPPSLIFNVQEVKANEVRTFNYLVKELELEKVEEPFVITDEKTIVELQIVNPTRTRLFFFESFPIEYLFFTIFVITFVSWVVYFFRNRGNKEKEYFESIGK